MLRAKVTLEDGTPGYAAGNGSLRDPVLYRVVKSPPHAKTGTKYKAYPTYDFACPIVDSLEGVTHVMRDSQYADRAAQFFWLQDALGLRRCFIQNFSRVNFKRTLMSKRKLAALVDAGVASGWDDPRFPTVKGMLRRGLQVESLREFMLMLGGSMRASDMEWDKVWSDNMRMLDKVVPRFMGVSAITPDAPAVQGVVRLTNFAEHHKLAAGDEDKVVVAVSIPLLPKEPEKGSKSVVVYPRVLVERVDLQGLEVGQMLGLMRYRVVRVDKVEKDDAGKVVSVDAFIVENGDFRSANRLVTWVSASPHEARVKVWEHDYLLNEGEEDEPQAGEGGAGEGGEEAPPAAAASAAAGPGKTAADWLKNINTNSIASSDVVVNACVTTLQKGATLQLERRGMFIVDKPFHGPDRPMELIKIPDGKSRSMSVIEGKLVHR